MSPGDPRREARDLGGIVAIARGGEHAGARVREQARGITVLLPETAARREIHLRQRLRRQRRDGCRLVLAGSLGSIAMRRSTLSGTAAIDVARADAAAVGAGDDGAVVRRARWRIDCVVELDAARAARAAIASGIRCTPCRAVKPRLADGAASARWRFENAPRKSSSNADTSCASRPKLTFKPYASAIARSREAPSCAATRAPTRRAPRAARRASRRALRAGCRAS